MGLREDLVFSTRRGLCEALTLGLLEELRDMVFGELLASVVLAGLVDRALVLWAELFRDGLREARFVGICAAPFAGLCERFLLLRVIDVVDGMELSRAVDRLAEVLRLLTGLLEAERTGLFGRLLSLVSLVGLGTSIDFRIPPRLAWRALTSSRHSSACVSSSLFTEDEPGLGTLERRLHGLFFLGLSVQSSSAVGAATTVCVSDFFP